VKEIFRRSGKCSVRELPRCWQFRDWRNPAHCHEHSHNNEPGSTALAQTSVCQLFSRPALSIATPARRLRNAGTLWLFHHWLKTWNSHTVRLLSHKILYSPQSSHHKRVNNEKIRQLLRCILLLTITATTVVTITYAGQ